jgi:hypothetical protein
MKMATKLGTSSNRSETGARDGSMPLPHDLKTYKFGLMGMLGITIFWIGLQNIIAWSL